MPDVELLFGPMLIGVFLNTTLYGILIMQLITYIQSSKAKSDSKRLRLFIFYLFLCETLNTSFDIYLIYEPLVQRYDTIRALTVAPLLLDADPIVTVMISVPVQLFICWRIRILTGSNVVTIIITLLALGALGGGIATTIGVSFAREYQSFSRLTPSVITWLGCSALADIIITAALVIALYKRQTGFRATDDVINRIIRLAVQTGLLTSIFAALDVIFFLSFPRTTLNFLWDFALSKLYTNSLLSTLNARTKFSASINVSRHPDNVLFGPGSQNSDRTTTTTATTITALKLKGESEVGHEYIRMESQSFQPRPFPVTPRTPRSTTASGSRPSQARSPGELEAGLAVTSPRTPRSYARGGSRMKASQGNTPNTVPYSETITSRRF